MLRPEKAGGSRGGYLLEYRVVGVLLALLLVYLFGSFVAATFMISEWSSWWRLWCATWGLFWAVAAAFPDRIVYAIYSMSE